MTPREHVILSIVADCLNVNINVEHMEFCNGTLFIADFSQDEANRVLYNLQYGGRFGKIVMSKVGDEYAFDFVS